MINIRTNVFETSSSSVHSMILCSQDDYNKWVNGEVLLNYYYNDDWVWKRWDQDAKKYVETIKGCPPQFVTEKLAAFYDDNYPYPPAKEDSWGSLDLEFKNKDGEWCERKFLTWEEYKNGIAADFDTFEQEYTTPKDETVVAIGFFGRDN